MVKRQQVESRGYLLVRKRGADDDYFKVYCEPDDDDHGLLQVRIFRLARSPDSEWKEDAEPIRVWRGKKQRAQANLIRAVLKSFPKPVQLKPPGSTPPTYSTLDGVNRSLSKKGLKLLRSVGGKAFAELDPSLKIIEKLPPVGEGLRGFFRKDPFPETPSASGAERWDQASWGPIFLRALPDYLTSVPKGTSEPSPVLFVVGSGSVYAYGKIGVDKAFQALPPGEEGGKWVRPTEQRPLSNDGLVLPEFIQGLRAFAENNRNAQAERQVPQFKSCFDIDAPKLLRENKDQHLIVTGMGNVNAVARKIWLHYDGLGSPIRPGPLHAVTNRLVNCHGQALQLGDDKPDGLGVLAVVRSPWSPSHVVILCCGEDALGTLACLDFISNRTWFERARRHDELAQEFVTERGQSAAAGNRFYVTTGNHPQTGLPALMVRGTGRPETDYRDEWGKDAWEPHRTSEGKSAVVGLVHHEKAMNRVSRFPDESRTSS